MKKSSEWLSENVGNTFDFMLGDIMHTSVLRKNKVLDYYFFYVMGVEYDATVCEIIE